MRPGAKPRAKTSQLRRAKLVKKILDNITIAILDFDYIVGRSTPSVIGACTAIDVCGDYIPDLWKDGDVQYDA